MSKLICLGEARVAGCLGGGLAAVKLSAGGSVSGIMQTGRKAGSWSRAGGLFGDKLAPTGLNAGGVALIKLSAIGVASRAADGRPCAGIASAKQNCAGLSDGAAADGLKAGGLAAAEARRWSLARGLAGGGLKRRASLANGLAAIKLNAGGSISGIMPTGLKAASRSRAGAGRQLANGMFGYSVAPVGLNVSSVAIRAANGRPCVGMRSAKRNGADLLDGAASDGLNAGGVANRAGQVGAFIKI